ncbi:amidohydrolase family protein [Streptomyces clavuligerus]|uniref:amidohydrolase family protein n=1 Tax=Streptomyces clavuligerus TaxID=1901 RepID=UPI000810D4D2|nr:amidohydrolase family protein [Streptomyces clavuligerus]ANW17060.1 amidohydrolase [Streptomyces clavuligerus]AXU11595.1 amidohydrolase [Streptomyces clavuligerus]MBY6301417.1 amidohydrolase family protein [Streptomyces clavuligerus]QPL61712.1 amidohydrolase family protein [Streptomyces clavuligerus]QPL67744.1 amidohydrolase family protein [Streptomyces clavuligerus]
MAVVDAHHHVWDLAVRDQEWITGPAMAPIRRDFSAADLAPEARAAGVRATVVVQTVTTAAETPELLALAQGSDLVAGVVGWTDLTAPDVADTLARLRELPGGERLVGIRHQVQGERDPRWLLRPDVRRGLAAVAAAGLVYDLVVTPGQLPAAAEAAGRLPELTFVLDHLGKPPIAAGEREPWADRVRALAAHGNTVCKLSGMVTEASWDSWTPEDLRPYAETVIEVFGPSRLMFGSDWPVCLLAADYARVTEAARLLTGALTEPERKEIFEAVACRVYGLPTA